MKKLFIGFLLFLVVGIGCFFLGTHYFLVFSPSQYYMEIGIVDGNISPRINDNYALEIKNITVYAHQETHGDTILNFLSNIGFSGSVYYYCAANDKEVINSKRVIDGLEWLKGRNIKKIVLSLSSTRYNKELETWIQNNPDICIFSSYSNALTTQNDYPSMYKGTYASGYNNITDYKETDTHYHSNRILVFHDGIYYYHGNSYLTLISLLNSEDEE